MEGQPSAPPIEVLSQEKSLKPQSSIDSIIHPSAPPVELPTFVNPVSEVELTLSASSLLNLDQITHSDPSCVVFLMDSTTSGEWVELGRTEAILNNLNPDWKTKFLVDYRFEEKQLLTFMIYDKDCAKMSLENHDFLGKLECSLGEIVSSPHSKFTRPLKLPSIHADSNHNSSITIMADEIGDCKKFLNFQLTCTNVTWSKGILAMSSKQVFINISKQVSDGSWILLYRTDRIPVGQNDEINFPLVRIRYSSICKKGNLEIPLRLQLHQVKHSFRGKSAKMIGEAVTNYIELVETFEKGQNTALALLSDRNGNVKDDEREVIGTLVISQLSIAPQKTFVDYLHDGLEITFAVAIDFTASNGEPTNHASLHYKHGKRDNPYVTTLKIVGEILEDYSSSKQFYAYGFGAKGFPVANRVNHKFSLNFKESNPLCDGIDGIISAYSRALHRVKLYGPTCFAPIIRELTEIARNSMTADFNNKYFVLLILTDGVVCDPDTTMEALIQASNAPLSVIIIGIGDEDFTTMEKFDSDDKLLKSKSKKTAIRDIVQFVELRKYVNFKSINPISNGSKVGLTRSILAELPQQVVAWMNLQKGYNQDKSDYEITLNPLVNPVSNNAEI